MNENVKSYIACNWDKCLCEHTNDEGTIIGLPHPYTVPTVGGMFRELYYWDTYFINVGLLVSEQYNQARNNIDNMLYLVDRYGFMPNGSRTYYLNRSQPPFLSMMVRDYFDAAKDKMWLEKAYPLLEKEHRYWMSNRLCKNGLNHYGYEITNAEDIASCANEYRSRTQSKFLEISDKDLAANFLAQAESGWDLNPRFDTMAHKCAAIDLNSLLWALENNMSYFATILDNGDKHKWHVLADARLKKCDSFLWNEDTGAYLDRNVISGSWSPTFSAASFYPLMVGMISEEKALRTIERLHDIEFEHGISCTEKQQKVAGTYQWAYPNGWACLQYVVAKGLMNYGYHMDAQRIEEKYISLANGIFDETGNLWEKYNVVTGTIQVNNEYDMPAMMGWTAGVYLYFDRELTAKQNQIKI